jgi:S-adenosylmethionine:tRNA ribosyltransferase-isomerase
MISSDGKSTPPARFPLMDLSQFSYDLPPELIAQRPLEDRAASRMLVLYREEGRWEDRTFRELPQFLHAGDCLILNDSRVFPSRLIGQIKPMGGEAEVFLVEPLSDDRREWRALVRPGRKLRPGERVLFPSGLEAEIVAHGEFGERTVRLSSTDPVELAIEKAGHVPLPPYIKRPDEIADRERYQTVYARERGSSAAPTAGLHFTEEMLDACQKAGAELAKVTLHVGLGTFQPLRDSDVEQNKLHNEIYSVSADEMEKIRSANRRIAVGTTSVRTIESAARLGLRGSTELFIYPGFEFQRTNALLTNFHLPMSSLLLLVCAFAGTDLTLNAYRHAVAGRYRFFSYGDCMLIV